MKTRFKPAVLAALLATSALAVLAQPAGSPPPEGGAGMHHRHSPEQRERMKDHMAKRVADLKAKLKLSAEQQGSWNAYLAAMKPATPSAPPKREDIAKLSTPERLDKMRELRLQRDTELDKRDAATRSFYGALNPEQKKVFDEQTLRHLHAHGPRGEGRPREERQPAPR
jgi:protein CpxP